jgi:hypothetical protein
MQSYMRRIYEILKGRRTRVNQNAVSFDENGVRRHLSNGNYEYVAWKDLQEVVILTTDDGPFAEDFFIILHGEEGSGCVVPLEQAASTGLVERLQTLPGFDNNKLAEASSSIRRGQWVCWQATENTSAS